MTVKFQSTKYHKNVDRLCLAFGVGILTKTQFEQIAGHIVANPAFSGKGDKGRKGYIAKVANRWVCAITAPNGEGVSLYPMANDNGHGKTQNYCDADQVAQKAAYRGWASA